MVDLADKMKELKKPVELYKIKRDVERETFEREMAKKEPEERNQKYRYEMNTYFSKIKEVGSALSDIDFEIEDTEPFLHDGRKGHPEMGHRWVLVKKANKNELFVRIYNGDMGGKILVEYKSTDERPLHVVKALYERLPAFLDVVTNRVRDALK
jgi:hypothetical protein